jgi:hypothetical protein
MPVKDFARDMASEALGLDSRMRRTLAPLVFEPGRVAAEYVAGHRARFVPPFRLYLMTSLLMFLVLSFGDLNVSGGGGPIQIGTGAGPTGSVEIDSLSTPADPLDADSLGAPADSLEPDSMNADDAANDSTNAGEEQTGLSARISDGFDRLVEDPERFRDQFMGNLSRAMFLLLPLFALLLKLAWWKRLYIHHFVFAMYLHSFAFMVTSVAGIPEIFGFTTIGQLADLLLLWIPVYLIIALRRFTGSSWVAAIAKGLAVYAGYGVLGGAIVGGALLLSVLTF